MAILDLISRVHLPSFVNMLYFVKILSFYLFLFYLIICRNVFFIFSLYSYYCGIIKFLLLCFYLFLISFEELGNFFPFHFLMEAIPMCGINTQRLGAVKTHQFLLSSKLALTGFDYIESSSGQYGTTLADVC